MELLGEIAAPRDIGVRKSVFQRVAEVFTGASEHRLRQPYGIAIDARGRIAVADVSARGVHLFDPAGSSYRFIARAGSQRLESPVGVAFDAAGRLWVSDSRLAMVVQLDERGTALRRLGGFTRPAGLAWHAGRGLLFVTDVQEHVVLGFDASGVQQVRFGGRGTEAGQLNFPTNLAVGADGSVYVTDAMNFRVQRFTPDGQPMEHFGGAGTSVGDLPRPKGVAVDSEGHVFVVEGLYDVVNLYTASGTHLLTVGAPGRGRGEFWLATGIAIDAQDRIYVADSHNARVQLFRLLRGGAR